MEASNYFTCIAYDSVDFLIPSKYVTFGIYLEVKNSDRKIIFNRETLPHIHIGSLLEKEFLCNSLEDCKVVLVMNMKDFAKDVCKEIVDYTNTAFPASGNLALSVNTSISSKIVDISSFHLIPQSIRARQSECGVCAIAFPKSKKNQNLHKKQILISPDNLIRKFFSVGLLDSREEI
ncbi:MAG: hypothetical protein K5873_12480 [Treponema sp.]|nr:hypothetical protein [Treponema sp.]